MYERYYGLTRLPFELSPDPGFLFLAASHREALSNLEYGLSAPKAVTVMIGEAGTGKTTLLHAALESDRCRRTRCVYLNNPVLSRDEFFQMLAEKFGLTRRAAESKTTMLRELEEVLATGRSKGEITALVIDEAQALSDELLEELRLLANIETASEKLLPLVLAGQPELGVRLTDPRLRQLKQRVALRCEIKPLNLGDTAAYITHRIRAAGGDATPVFTREAITAIHEYSRGIPRSISVICDNALLSGFALDRRPVDCAIVGDVCRDFDLGAADPVAPVLTSPMQSQLLAEPVMVAPPFLERHPYPVDLDRPPSPATTPKRWLLDLFGWSVASPSKGDIRT